MYQVVGVCSGHNLTGDFALADQICGLTDAAEGARVLGAVTGAEAEAWLAELIHQALDGALIVSLAGYTAVGEKT